MFGNGSKAMKAGWSAEQPATRAFLKEPAGKYKAETFKEITQPCKYNSLPSELLTRRRKSLMSEALTLTIIGVKPRRLAVESTSLGLQLMELANSEKEVEDGVRPTAKDALASKAINTSFVKVGEAGSLSLNVTVACHVKGGEKLQILPDKLMPIAEDGQKFSRLRYDSC